MELREALVQIAEIRQQMARGQIFRGYRAATTACSGVIAMLAGVAQFMWIQRPATEARPFIYLWMSAAAVSLLVVAAEMIFRTRRSNSVSQRQLTLLAVEQFTPSLIAGGLLSYVFGAHLHEQLWMLPGLWMVVFSLGVFASARLLPRPVFVIGGFYLLAGIMTLLASHEHAEWALSPWLMAGTFGVGQLATAGILYWKLERGHE